MLEKGKIFTLTLGEGWNDARKELIKIMKEDNKYYVPEIEEFHVGFEFETFRHESKYATEVGWNNQVFGNEMFLNINKHTKTVRVKYLDQSDIESLGYPVDEWFIAKGTRGGTYKIELIGSGIMPRVTIKLKNHIRDNSGRYEEMDVIWRAFIKNKSELKKLLKQLGI